MNLKALVASDYNIDEISAVLCSYENDAENDYGATGRPNYLLHFMLDKRAKRIYHTENGEFSATCGDVIFIPQNSKYRTVVRSTDGAASTGLGIAFKLFDRHGKEIIIPDAAQIVTRDGENHYLERLFLQVYQAFTRCPNDNFAVKAALYRLISAISNNAENKSEIYKTVRPALDYIDEHVHESISVKTLAELCNFSETQFRRLFKNYTNGISPIRYVLRLKLNLAAEYSLSCSYSLQKIAEMLNFYDAATLCKTYKKFTGRTLKNRAPRNSPQNNER
ncbi:MAG: AraC family transcriptional regulator [Candidatus Neoclostridium sp.]